jgi:hypothetical protein
LSVARNYDMPPGNGICESYSVLTECIQAGIPVALVPIPSEHETFKDHKLFCLPAKLEYGFSADEAYKKELGEVLTNSIESIPGLLAARVASQAAAQAQEMADDAASGLFDLDFDENDDDDEPSDEWVDGFDAGIAEATEVDETGMPKLWAEGFQAGKRAAKEGLDTEE